MGRECAVIKWYKLSLYTIQAYRKDLTFVVTELDHYDILLGKLWLTTKNPEIDWRCNTATFPWQGAMIQLTTREEIQPGAIMELSAIQLKRLMKTNPKGIICILREEEEEKGEPKKAPKKTPKEQIHELDIPPEMKNVLQLHVDVFADLPDGLPLPRPVDHEIPLQPIYQRTYKMGELELRELRTQLELYLKKGVDQAKYKSLWCTNPLC